MWFASAPARSPNGPTRCPTNSRHRGERTCRETHETGGAAIGSAVCPARHRIVGAQMSPRDRGAPGSRGEVAVERPVVGNRSVRFFDIVPELKARLPNLRGRLIANEPLGPLTWFRVGGPAQALFMPQDDADLAYLLGSLPAEIPVFVLGLGSNLIVRDGGVPGVVIRLGRGFNNVVAEPGQRIRAGAAVPDVKVARAAQDAGIAGLAFFRGIPGAIGGALRMNGGAYGGETKDVLVAARGVDRTGRTRVFGNAEMQYSYRDCGVPDDVIFTEALFQGTAGDPAIITAEMDKITESRETTQPIKSRTGG